MPQAEVAARQQCRNAAVCAVDWRLAPDDARITLKLSSYQAIKPKRPYPTIHEQQSTWPPP